MTISVGFPEHLRDAAAALYMEAFGAKLGPILGRGDRARDFLASVMSPRHAVAAVTQDGELLGLAGFHDERGALVGGGFRDLARAYGTLGALWRAPLLAIFEREPAPGQLLMDGVVVSPAARSRGIGRALLMRIAALAKETGRREVRLEVVDANPRARALYEKLGFESRSETGSSLLRPFFGFSRATTMVLPV